MFYAILDSYRLLRGIFHYSFELFDFHFSFFGSALQIQVAVLDELNKHSYFTDTDAFFSAFSLDILTKIAHNKHFFIRTISHRLHYEDKVIIYASNA